MVLLVVLALIAMVAAQPGRGLRRRPSSQPVQADEVLAGKFDKSKFGRRGRENNNNKNNNNNYRGRAPRVSRGGRKNKIVRPGDKQAPGLWEDGKADTAVGVDGKFNEWYEKDGAAIDAARDSSPEAMFKASRTEQYWQRLSDALTKLKTGGTSTAEKMNLIKTLTDQQNIVAKGEKAGVKIHGGQGGGNCAMSTISTLLSLGTGGVNCALSQQRGIPVHFGAQVEQLKSMGWYVDKAEFSSGNQDELLAKLQVLKEGQIAYVELWSSDSKIGHAVGVIRLDGELYTINNQGWDRNINGLEKIAVFIPRLMNAFSKTAGAMRCVITNIVLPK